MEEALATTVSANTYAIGAFVGYLLLVIAVGVYATRFSSTGISEFFVGGRKMNRFVVALSAVVSGRSAWLLLGVTGMAYKMGASAVWAVTGYIVVELFMFLYYARRMRRYCEVHDCITLPDFYASRFNDRDGLLRTVLVAIILIFMVSYISAQFVSGGKAFAASFDLDPGTGILLTASIVVIYTVFGGFLAVSLTDMFQAFFMVVALIVLPVIAISDKNGLNAVLLELGRLDETLLDPTALSFGAAIGFLGIGLGSTGNPHVLVRYISIDDPEQLRFSALIGTVWNVLMAWGALFIGLAGRAWFPDVAMLPNADTENLYPVLAQLHLHPALFGVVVASIFAAIMSTADSQLLVAASSVVRDVYEKILRRDEVIPQKRLVIYSRIVVIILVLAALFFGWLAEELVFWLVLFAWAGLGAAIGPTSILAFYWKKTTRAGVIAGLVAGTLTTLFWYYTPALKQTVYELVPAFAAGLLATVVVSLFTRPPEDTEQKFAAMEKPNSPD